MNNNPEKSFFLHTPGKLSRGAVLDVGLKCVHSCKFCYYSYLDQSDDQFSGMRRAKFRTLDECKAILDGIKQNGFINFDYTGGEPALHQDIIEITRYAHHELGLKGRMITLGQYLMRHMKHGKHDKQIDDLLEAGMTNFLFSMHAVEENSFKYITGASWKKLQSAMDYLDTKDFQYTSNTTIMELNYKQLPDIAREILKHGIYLHNFIIMNAYYEWNKDGKAFGVQARYSDIQPYLQEAVNILESNNVAVNIRYAPLCTLPGMEKNIVGMVGVRYDPYEWMNGAGHGGGSPEFCASVLPVNEGDIEDYLLYRDATYVHENNNVITGVRGQNIKHFTDKCSNCSAKPVCDGIDPNYLMNNGSDEFTPYTEDQHIPLHKDRYKYLMPFIVKTQPYTDMKSLVELGFQSWRLDHSAVTRPVDSVPDIEQHKTPVISVIITCYNYGKYLKEAIGSVFNQTYTDYEIIVVDDGSTDNTTAVLEEVLQKNKDKNVRIIHQDNSGQPAHSRNRGISEAKGEFILCLDADDMIAPNMLEACLEILINDNNTSIAYTDRYDFDGIEQVVQAEKYDADRLPYNNFISYCALYRRKVWKDIGGYRDNVKGCEDWDFWVAAREQGHSGTYIAAPLFLYRRHDTGLYQHALANFEQKHAQIVLNNQTAYQFNEIDKAKNTLGINT